MSIKEVKGFYERVANDEELVKQLDEIQNKVTEGLELPLPQDKKEELIKDVIIPFAKEQGFEFSIEDIREYEQSIIDKLDDEQLESIAAGRLSGGLGGGFCKIAGFGIGFFMDDARKDYNCSDGYGCAVCLLLGFGRGKGGCVFLGVARENKNVF